MKIELFDRRGIKIVLSAADLSNLNLTYETIDEQHPQTRRALILLMRAAKQQTGLDLISKSLLIEAYPYADGGCILYISEKESSGTAKHHPSEHVFKLPSLFHAVCVCRTLEQYFGHIILKSALYHQNHIYYLILYSYNAADPLFLKLLAPYAAWRIESNTAGFLIEEYAQPVFETQATASISALFSKMHE